MHALDLSFSELDFPLELNDLLLQVRYVGIEKLNLWVYIGNYLVFLSDNFGTLLVKVWHGKLMSFLLVFHSLLPFLVALLHLKRVIILKNTDFLFLEFFELLDRLLFVQPQSICLLLELCLMRLSKTQDFLKMLTFQLCHLLVMCLR